MSAHTSAERSRRQVSWRFQQAQALPHKVTNTRQEGAIAQVASVWSYGAKTLGAVLTTFGHPYRRPWGVRAKYLEQTIRCEGRSVHAALVSRGKQGGKCV